VISMCGEQEPANVAEALSMLDRALGALATADAGSLPTPVQAHALRALERAEARHTAARAQFLAAFTAQDGYEDDGQGSARTWLRWQTRVTKAAAAGSVGWMRRLAVHPVIAAALTGGEVSASWARAICGWSERLPEDMRGDADQILAAAAAGAVGLSWRIWRGWHSRWPSALIPVPPMPMRTDSTTGGWCWTARSREQAGSPAT
jgi:hypothetical protein